VRFPALPDQSVAESLRALPGVQAGAAARTREMFARAERHGVAGVIWDAWKASGAEVEPDLAAKLEMRALAREMDHAAHLAMLARVDAALTGQAVPAVALKGPLFAARYYEHPSSRGTSDIDLLVAETDVARAIEALATIDYQLADSAEEAAWSLREHHHLHLARNKSPDLELHFHAYRGFGVTVRTEMLAQRGVPVAGLGTIRVPCAEDELVYLAVHAASHRFGRLAWLHDVRLVVERLSPEALATAAERARAWGVGRALSLAGELLVEVLGVPADLVRPLGALPASRRALVHAVVAEPPTRVWSAATRFAYTTLLADSMSASLRYARTSSLGHVRRILGLS
jgi:hypothetical protein